MHVNIHLVCGEYPLPKIDDLFSKRAGGEMFTKTNLRQAYLQMQVADSSRQLLPNNTHKGWFRYTRTLYGLHLAPTVWQRTMEQVLAGINGVLDFLDDIRISGNNENEHLARLDSVIAKLREYGLRANKSKCSFFLKSVYYCGFTIDKNGLHKSNKKNEAIVNAPTIRNVTEF